MTFVFYSSFDKLHRARFSPFLGWNMKFETMVDSPAGFDYTETKGGGERPRPAIPKLVRRMKK